LARLFLFLALSLPASAQEHPASDCTPATYLGISGCAVQPGGECPAGYHKQAVGPSDPRMKAPTRLMCVPNDGAASGAGERQLAKKVVQYPNGRTQAEYSFYRGSNGEEVLDGAYTTWRAGGQKESSCNYADGQKEGICRWWDAHGRQVDSVEYVHGKPRAIADWEALHSAQAPVYLYPYIVVHPSGSLTFISNYAEINRDFSRSHLEEVLASLPELVWVEGKSIGIQKTGMATERQHRVMTEVAEKVKSFLVRKGYRVHGLPQ